MEVFKWVKGFNKGDINKAFIVKGKVRTRTNGFKLDKFRVWKEIYKNCFTNMVVEEWNKLSMLQVNTFTKRFVIYMDEENKW